MGQERVSGVSMSERPEVVVIGASLAGLFAAAAANGTGRRVTVLERDDLPTEPVPRRGVPQGEQVHVLLHRGLLAAEELLPGLRADLIAAGAIPIDTGDLPWLGEFGWLPIGQPAHEFLSASRPLVEHVVRQRVLALPDVRVVTGARVRGLDRDGARWLVQVETGPDHGADLVVDASGRSSRLPAWLSALGVSEVRTSTVDARVGYTTRRYTPRDGAILGPGVVVQVTPHSPVGGLALPVEDGDWLVLAYGLGEHRPSRGNADFAPFLSRIRDTALVDLLQRCVPIGEAVPYRQTSNLRRHYERLRACPEGLVVIGDALCTFNPLYGQGITVAACEAVLLHQALAAPGTDALDCRRLQRRFASVLELPWAVATGEDLRHASSGSHQSVRQRILVAWSRQLGMLAVHGNERALATVSRVYHLMASPKELFHPALVADVLRARVRGYPPPAPRPDTVEALGPA